MKRFGQIIGFAFGIFWVAGASQAPADDAGHALTLVDCIQRGMERSIPLANARRDVEIARMQIRAVRAEVHPHLDANANYTRIDEVPMFPGTPGPIGQRNTYAASLDAEQLLYAGGSIRAALRVAAFFEERAQRELERVESDLIRRITYGFYEIHYRESALDVAAQSVHQLEALERQTRARYDARTASEFEWLSAQVALANERPALIAAANAHTLARRTFRDLIHLDDDAFSLAGSLDVTPAILDLAFLQQHAVDHRPEILQARADMGVALNARRVTYGDYFPEFRAFASYGGADPSQRNPFAEGWEWEWMAGIRLTWNLFDGGKRRADLHAETMEIEKIGDKTYDLIRETRLEVERLWLTLEEARQTLRGTADNIALAERALHIASVRHEQGLATHLDFTDSNLALNNARLNHNRALLGYQQTLADLRHITGLRDIPARENQP